MQPVTEEAQALAYASSVICLERHVKEWLQAAMAAIIAA